MLNVSKIRRDFPVLSRRINKKPVIYLDSAASSLKPQTVISAVSDYYQNYGVNIFRGVYHLSEEATQKYEEARELIARFIGVENSREIVFVRNATEAINLVAASWTAVNLPPGANIVSTVMEHHANLVPWQIASAKNKARLRFLDITSDGTLKIKDLEKTIDKKTALLVFTFVSNVLGTINPVKDIIKKAKSINPHLKVLIDAAQAVPHLKVDVDKLGADFIAFSGHKMLGPTGIGVLWAKEEILEAMPPYQSGGDMIREVYLDHTVYNQIPHRFEAGTPHIAGAIGLAEAVRYLDKLGMENIRNHEKQLTSNALSAFSKLKKVTVYGPSDVKKRGGVVAFNVKGVHPHDMAQILDRDNICIRSGHHCAMPLHQRLKIPASCRASFYLYNTKDDIDHLIEGIEKAVKLLG